MMWFTGLGIGHLEYKAHTIHRLTVEDEPNWLELCSTTAVAAKSDLAVVKSDDDTSSDGTPEDDLNGDDF